MTAQPLPGRQPRKPFTTSFEGYAVGDDWPNTVRITTVTGYDPDRANDTTDDDRPWADAYGNRELVEVDTNYKATREGQHPVSLTRTDAAALAAAVLTATEDSFHAARCGQLRPAEAAELLRALEHVEVTLSQLREHALFDLLDGTSLDPDFPPEDPERR